MSEEPGTGEDASMRRIVDKTTQLTPLRVVAVKAIQMAQDDRTHAMDLANVISADQALTAKILRLSNSAYYGYARRISNVREAVILLGMRTVRSVAISSAIIDAFRLPAEIGPFKTDLFWAHSVSVGLVSEILARETKICRPADAFTAGVLHDVGKLATILSDPSAFRRVVEIVDKKQRSFHDAELDVLGVAHGQIGAELVASWNFPEHLVEAVRSHHPPEPVAKITTLAELVSVADLACLRSGMAAGFDRTSEAARHAPQFLPPEAERALARVPRGMDGVSEKARAFFVNVTTHPPAWYGQDGQLSANDRAVA